MDYNFIYKELSGIDVANLTTTQIQEMKNFILGITEQMPNYTTFTQILDRQLKNVPDDKDKRQGSIIYDALAPCSGEFANGYIVNKIQQDQVYL